MARNKTVEYRITKKGFEPKKQRSLIAEVGGKYYTIKPDNAFYSIVEHYGKVIRYI